MQAGFLEAGAVSLPHPDSVRDAQRFEQFIQSGFAGSMQYLARRNDEGALVRADIRTPFPWARSIVVCLAGYHSQAPLSTAPAPPGAGWIARYAWSGRPVQPGESIPKGDDPTQLRPSDYHKVLLKRLRTLESAMRTTFGGFESRAYVDTGPVVERAAARAAGLGWTGKNTCLIHPRLGSWNFLAVLVTSLSLAEEQAALAIPDRCGTCRRCLDACPTGALIEPYKMDATRCISYLTIEHRGEIDDDLKAGMGRQIFGCDICQDVCPWNQIASRKAPMVSQDSGLAIRPELVNPDLDWLASLESADFERLFNGSPVRRAGFAALRRNLAITMGNSRLSRYRARLQEWAGPHGDRSNDPARQNASSGQLTPLQSAARWALRQLGSAGEEQQ
jgi:epoxyqueuosine reductase